MCIISITHYGRLYINIYTSVVRAKLYTTRSYFFVRTFCAATVVPRVSYCYDFFPTFPLFLLLLLPLGRTLCRPSTTIVVQTTRAIVRGYPFCFSAVFRPRRHERFSRRETRRWLERPNPDERRPRPTLVHGRGRGVINLAETAVYGGWPYTELLLNSRFSGLYAAVPLRQHVRRRADTV